MIYRKYIGLFFLLTTAMSLHAQKAERDLIRKGNRMYNDSVYEQAEINLTVYMSRRKSIIGKLWR